MSNNTARLARKWAERIKAAPDETYVDDVVAAAEHILATTTPPTMADVEWDDEKHHLGGATLPGGGEVVMLWHDDIDTDHIITDHAEWPRDRLTPNGKRYELREVGTPEQPAHPETLVTEADYENAPHGTVVSGSETLDLYVKNVDLWHRLVTPNGPTLTVSSVSMAGTPRTVLRKGWGK